MKKHLLTGTVLGLAAGVVMSFGATTNVFAAQPTMSEADFESTKALYFQRCAGCHGVLRKGATGKNLEPKSTMKVGQKNLERIITEGTDGGMNPFNDIFSADQISKLATYIQITPPVPPEMTLAMMKAATKIHVDPKDYPTKPLHGRNWENFFIVIERDVGKIAIVDGDKHEIVAHVDSGYAVHVLKAVEHHKFEKPVGGVAGRFWFIMGRDGKMSKVDLWQVPEKMLVAETKIGYDARDVAVSGDGKLAIGGAYWPPHAVIVDALTMEPLKVISTRGTNVDGEYVNESRVAAVYTTPNASTFLISAKELGKMIQVDYTDLDNLKTTEMDTAKFLHDGFFDPTGRYFQIAANASNTMVVIDTEKQKLEALIKVGKKPHPGPGANWVDAKCGPVSGTVFLGEGKITAWGNDPKGHPDQAWKECYSVTMDGPSVFLRTHPKSQYVIADQTKSPDEEVRQAIQVLDIKTRKLVKTLYPTDKPGFASVHIEFNADGSEFWVSVWNRKDNKKPLGEIVVYDTKTLEEKARIKGFYTPTGKFNVYNRTNHVT